MWRKSIMIMLLAAMIVMFILLWMAARLSGSERNSPQFLTTFLPLIMTSPTTIAATSNSSVAAQGDSNAIVSGVFIVTAAIISTAGGIFAAFIANGYFQRRRKRKVQKRPMIDSGPKTTREYAQHYRRELLKDPNITTLQILTMKRPLKVTDVYVQLRLSHDERSIEELAWEARYDPVTLPQMNHQHLNSRIRSAMEPEKAISTCLSQRCVIVGDPGAGKTTLLKYLAVKSAKGELTNLPDLPVYIELNAFASSGKNDLLDYATSYWQERYDIPKAKALKCIKDNLKDGSLLLLLDGLNEAATGGTFEDGEASYKRVETAISRIGLEAPIIITARKADYRQRPRMSGFTELEVLDFRPEDIKRFVKCWFADHPNPYRREDAKELNYVIERNPRIQALARNPLLLAEIAIVYEEDLQLPQNQAELYRRCVDILLIKWNAERNIRRPKQFSVENKKNLLKDIAWYFHERGQRYFPTRELLSKIEEFLPAVDLERAQNRQILSAIAAEDGLLKEHAQGWYGFLHMTMQEFFVAQRIHDQDQINTLLMHCDESWWEEVLLLYAVYSEDASSLLQQLLNRGSRTEAQDDFFYTNLLLAGRCIATHAPIRQITLRNEIISHLFNILTTTLYSLIRHQIVEILAEIGGTKVNSQLLKLLADKNVDREVQIEVVKALGVVGEQTLAGELLKKLSENTIDKEVRKYIAEALGRMGDRSLASDLLKILREPGIEDEVGGSIADALGMLGASGRMEEESKVISDFVELLSRKQMSSYVRRRVAYALGKYGNRSLAPRMMGLVLEQKVDFSVCMSIVDALSILGEQSVVHNLEGLLSNQQIYPAVRMSVADALGRLGVRSSGLKLKEILLRRSENPDLRGHVAIALGMLGDRSLASTFLELLSSPGIDTFVSQSSVIALSKLLKRFSSSDFSSTIFHDLLALLSNAETDSGVRIRIADLLGDLGDRAMASDLLNLLFDLAIDSQVREAIVDALGRLGEPAVATKLFSLLSYPSLELNIKGHIAYVLCILQYADAFSISVKLLSEEKLDLYIRWLIADSLGALGEYVQPSILIQLLSKTEIDKDVRRRLANVLAPLVSDQDSVRELAELLQTSDIADDVYRTVWVASRKIGVRVTISAQDKHIEVARWQYEINA